MATHPVKMSSGEHAITVLIFWKTVLTAIPNVIVV
jgi:hypothetical protein